MADNNNVEDWLWADGDKNLKELLKDDLVAEPNDEQLELLGDLISEREDDLHNLDDDQLTEVLELFGYTFDPFDRSDVGELSWMIQRLRGQAAKAAGFDAVEMSDEFGVSYLLLPGDGVRKIDDPFLDDNGPDGSGGGKNTGVRYSFSDSNNDADQGYKAAADKQDTWLEKAGDNWRTLKAGAMQGLLSLMNGRQIADSFHKLFEGMGKGNANPLKKYQTLLQAMTTLRQNKGHRGDRIDDKWGKIKNRKDYEELASLMHDSTLAQIDPSTDNL